MREGARIQAAIEILADIAARRRPAADALKDWGLARRFAGSRDRAAIASLVYDALRHRASSAWRMGSDEARAIVLATVRARGLSAGAMAELFAGDPHAPELPSPDERAALETEMPEGAPAWVRGDYPEWLHPSLARVFGEDAAEEGAALSTRAPLDLRVNALRSSREKCAEALAHLAPEATPYSPYGLRIVPADDGGRTPHVHSEPAFLKGWIEIQDEGSQVATILSGAQPGHQVADICAGAGGKTLALAAIMGNKGQIYAHDSDRRRLAPIYDRLQRAGVRNAQVRPPGPDAFAGLEGRLDLVLVDAPCTGTGTWRRHPDAKWRIRPGALARRLEEQRAALDTASGLVRAGGRIAYVTCSVLPQENEDQVSAFLGRRPDYRAVELEPVWRERLGSAPPEAVIRPAGLLLTPRRTDTDGFFIALLERTA